MIDPAGQEDEALIFTHVDEDDDGLHVYHDKEDENESTQYEIVHTRDGEVMCTYVSVEAVIRLIDALYDSLLKEKRDGHS